MEPRTGKYVHVGEEKAVPFVRVGAEKAVPEGSGRINDTAPEDASGSIGDILIAGAKIAWKEKPILCIGLIGVSVLTLILADYLIDTGQITVWELMGYDKQQLANLINLIKQGPPR